MKHLSILVLAIFFLCGCSDLSDKKQEVPGVITIIDVREAEFVREVLAKDVSLTGTYTVEPGQTETTVSFSEPDTPGDEEALRKSMRQIKEILTENRGRTANTLVFVFPQVTLKE